MKDWGGVLFAAAILAAFVWVDHHMTKLQKLLSAILETLQENGSRLDSLEEEVKSIRRKH